MVYSEAPHISGLTATARVWSLRIPERKRSRGAEGKGDRTYWGASSRWDSWGAPAALGRSRRSTARNAYSRAGRPLVCVCSERPQRTRAPGQSQGRAA
eukprot:scaffold265261_cov32-Tisochrysis_lutea.AAC.3